MARVVALSRPPLTRTTARVTSILFACTDCHAQHRPVVTVIQMRHYTTRNRRAWPGRRQRRRRPGQPEGTNVAGRMAVADSTSGVTLPTCQKTMAEARARMPQAQGNQALTHIAE